MLEPVAVTGSVRLRGPSSVPKVRMMTSPGDKTVPTSVCGRTSTILSSVLIVTAGAGVAEQEGSASVGRRTPRNQLCGHRTDMAHTMYCTYCSKLIASNDLGLGVFVQLRAQPRSPFQGFN
jgi:hypothetical protein